MKEISLHILDLVQNSITADAKNIKIEILEDSVNDRFTVRVTDDGRGMTQELVQSVVDPFVTTRTTRKVGLGIPLFLAGCQMCGGDLKIESEIGKGTTVQGWYIRSHIDRPPLGDIVGTVTLLLASNPHMGFRFIHKLDDKDYDLDTGQIKGVLGEVPLDSPDVLAWIKNYLQNNEIELYGGTENNEIVTGT